MSVKKQEMSILEGKGLTAPINYLPKGSPHQGGQSRRELRKFRKGPKVRSKEVRIKPECVEVPPCTGRVPMAGCPIWKLSLIALTAVAVICQTQGCIDRQCLIGNTEEEATPSILLDQDGTGGVSFGDRGFQRSSPCGQTSCRHTSSARDQLCHIL